jgi:hypothetical protein
MRREQHGNDYHPSKWRTAKINRPEVITVEGAYIGGLFNSTLSIRATLAPSVTSQAKAR